MSVTEDKCDALVERLFTAGLGMAEEETFERYAKEAGFDAVSVLPIEHDFLRFYRLDR